MLARIANACGCGIASFDDGMENPTGSNGLVRLAVLGVPRFVVRVDHAVPDRLSGLVGWVVLHHLSDPAKPVADPATRLANSPSNRRDCRDEPLIAVFY